MPLVATRLSISSALADRGPVCYRNPYKRTIVRILTRQEEAMSTLTPAPVSLEVPTGSWRLDPVHSSAGFAVKHMGVSTFRGRFEDLDATLEVADDGGASLSGAVRVDSLQVKDENLQAHLGSPEFFDVERHPEIAFRSSSLRREGDELVLDGELTIKDKTRPVHARGEITGPSVILGDQARVGISLEAVIDRTEYGLDWNAPLPKGGFAVGDEVKLSIELELAPEEG
ncbi:MAG: YceI family protein [Actinobacteria bacterium]|nr:MAG: YceI family protein [Actinomycetota bacterium]